MTDLVLVFLLRSELAFLSLGFPCGSAGKESTWVRSLGWEDPLEKGKATHSGILAWRIPWTVQSMGSQRVRQDWATLLLSLAGATWSLWSLEKGSS